MSIIALRALPSTNKRFASFHASNAKAWVFSLFTAALAPLYASDVNAFVYGAIVLGILSNIDGIAIKAIHPRWQHDVPSAWHALCLRRAEMEHAHGTERTATPNGTFP